MKTPLPPVTMRLGLSPRACWARWVEGWKKFSRSQRSRTSLVSIVLLRCDVSCRSRDVAADIFEVGIGFHAMARALAAESRLLDAAEGDRRAGDPGAVDGDHAELERRGEAGDARI